MSKVIGKFVLECVELGIEVAFRQKVDPFRSPAECVLRYSTDDSVYSKRFELGFSLGDDTIIGDRLAVGLHDFRTEVRGRLDVTL